MATFEDMKAYLQRRRTNFRLCYGSPAGRQALADLSDFCHATKTTMRGNDPYELARNEGRRQVFLRICRAIDLTADEQLAIMAEKDHP
jgi:hypothetical protein